MKLYKGFDKDLCCAPGGVKFQYEAGKTYEEEKAVLCNRGFHACENPLDVLRYYRPCNQSRYCEVEADGVTDERKDDTKRVCKKISIGAEIGLPGIIQAGVNFVFEKTADATESISDEENGNAAASGWNGNAAASGRYGNAAASGENGNAAASGERAIAASIGIDGTASAALGNWIVLADWQRNEDGSYYPAEVKAVMVDGKTIKANVKYKMRDGEIVEA